MSLSKEKILNPRGSCIFPCSQSLAGPSGEHKPLGLCSHCGIPALLPLAAQEKGALCGSRGLSGPSRAGALFSLFVRDGEG